MKNKIYNNLKINDFKQILALVDQAEETNKEAIILKFGASWCGPCNRIKDYCHNIFSNLNEKIICFDLDIDEENNLELYQSYKSKKMIKTIPVLFCYKSNKERNNDHWWIPDFSVNSSNLAELDIFFSKVNTLTR